MGREDELFSDKEWEHLVVRFALSPHQREIAALMCAGHTYKSIACETGISANTVRMHLRALFTKLDVDDRVSLIHQLITAARLLPSAAQPPPDDTH